MKHILAYIYEFVSMLMDKRNAELIEKIILFGSVARNDFDENSDIDLFIEVRKGKEEVEKLIRETLVQFDTKATKTWHLRNIKHPIKPIVGKLDEPQWKELSNEIIGTGIVLFGKYERTPSDLNQYLLISYELNKLNQNKKMKFLRKLYGYKTKKKSKVYTQAGLLHSINGIKFTFNQIMISVSQSKKVLDVLKEFKIPYKIQEIWIR